MVLRRLPELLAPAGSPEALRAAVAAGADAVYLSGRRFGARKFAVNFDEPALAEAIDYAHLRGLRVYVTVNTLILDHELQDAGLYLLRLYEMGADAVLVQDIGLAALARRLTPELDLHASTQMTIHNREGAAWAAKFGFKRVVLAREIGLEEIRAMAEDLELGLEVFVHGALCYCYSGQCLLSSAIGGRSGNRGMCAQPCRKPYVLLRGEQDEYGRPVNLAAVPSREQYLLSTRDLSSYRHLDEIVRSPVQSLKIEGRMKSPEYVAIVTSIYRKALDGIARGSWAPSDEDERELALAFNREFTAGHLLGAKEVMGRMRSDNQGVLIGTVVSFDAQRNEAAVRLTGPSIPEQGDGLVFIAPGQELGLVVQRPLQKDGLLRLKVPERVRPGARVFITSSSALSRKAASIISSAPKQIPIDLRIYWDDRTMVIEGRVEKGIKVQVRAGFEMELALSRPLTATQIEAQLRRTGGTPFAVRKLEMSYPGGLFAPLGALNQLRRELLARAQEALLDVHRPGPEEIAAARERLAGIDLAAPAAPAAPKARVPSLAVYADSLEAVRGAIEGGCKRLYFEPILGQEQKNRAQKMLELLHEARAICGDAELIWKWPKITRESYLQSARQILAGAELDGNGIMVEGMGAAGSALAARRDIRLYGASGLNVWNHLTVQYLANFQRLTLSPELSARQMAQLVAMAHRRTVAPDSGAPELELVVQGNLEVVVAEDSLPLGQAGFWGLQDFRRIFPLRSDDEGRMHIFNSVETCLLDHLPRIFEIGLDGVAIDARGRKGLYAREMTEIYLKAIEATEKGSPSLGGDLQALKEEARARSLGGITTGHFLKGLKEELS